MREKLIELLRSVQYQGNAVHGYHDKYIQNRELADHLIANGVTIQRWIPVSERLPDIDLPCLCYKEVHGTGVYRLGKYFGATLSENCAAFKSMSHYGVIGVSHWMPLPQPPKEGE